MRMRRLKSISLGQNLLPNSGFETEEKNGLVSGWNVGVSRSAEKLFSGETSGYFANTSSFPRFVFSEKIKLPPAGQRVFLFTGQNLSQDSLSEISVFHYSRDLNGYFPQRRGPFWDRIVLGGSLGKGWEKKEALFFLPQGAEFLALRIGLLGEGEAWFDDFSIQQLSFEFAD